MPVTFIDDVENTVFDHDVGRNGTFQLFIDPPTDTFEIIPEVAVNEATFIIRVKDPLLLDYEMQTEVNFTIIAKEVESPGKWSAAHVQVFIVDQNDNYPEFTQSVYNVTIPENSEVGSFITQIKAYDKDSDDFGTMGIRYKNLRGSIAHLLTLDPVVGTLSIKSTNSEAFDREIVSRYYLTVEAIDNNGLGNRNTAQIIIDLEDVNDNAPIFLQHQYEANLLENKDDFENPLILEARDLDLEDTENSQITYEIIDGI
uniref:Cadherin domain-containing protein n=1 Tax=Megaselia scalaris TaxID=36166 RepID=T1H1K7_MEGSC